jgi:hypothetical protein
MSTPSSIFAEKAKTIERGHTTTQRNPERINRAPSLTDVTHPFGLGVAASQLNYNIIFCLRLTPQANGFRRFAAFDND